MPYTFGAGTGDDLTFGNNGNLGGTTTGLLVCGWWLPTTLTATRGLWSAGNTIGAEIDTTTSELRLRTDNTTDGQWTTTGANLSTNSWKFLAFLNTCNNTGPAAAWRVWAGDLENPPAEVTVTNAVAPVGNFTNNQNFYVGNKGTGALAFQGDIGPVGFVYTSNYGTAGGIFGGAAAGAITDAEAELTLKRFILPMWSGKAWRGLGWPYPNASMATDVVYALLTMEAGLQAIVYRINSSSAFSGVTPTINGATVSQNGPPVPVYCRSIHPDAYMGQGF